jgi:NAD(P)-dependent dehydrogenase (short-subunit alcohol dehydrogenase family)
MTDMLKDKVVLVTGAGGGIGRAVALGHAEPPSPGSLLTGRAGRDRRADSGEGRRAITVTKS